VRFDVNDHEKAGRGRGHSREGAGMLVELQKDRFVGVSCSPGGAEKRTAIEKRARAQGRASEE